jgi:hypothetical protein
MDQITLSRRNVLYLLSKLERGGQAYIIKPHGPIVAAEPDAIHYKDRDPGPFSDETERDVREIESLLALCHFLKGDWQEGEAPRIPEDWNEVPITTRSCCHE